MRRLIINADDFGLTAGVNRGIVEAHERGVVTSATLMADARACEAAVALAEAHPRLAVGCHIVLVDGEPLLESERISSLLGRDRRFRPNLLGFARAAIGGKLIARELTAEATAQIKAIQEAGIAVSHIDAHKHAHLFPRVLEPLLQAARACGVRAVRNPFAPARALQIGALARRPRLWKRRAQVALLRRFGGGFRRQVAEHGMITTDGTFGIVSTGALDLELFRAIVDCIPEGTWEFVCHPGYNDADLAQAGTRLQASREQELRVLTSPQARVSLERQGIELISYRELMAAVAV